MRSQVGIVDLFAILAMNDLYRLTKVGQHRAAKIVEFEGSSWGWFDGGMLNNLGDE